jgi:hypothetical protein
VDFIGHLIGVVRSMTNHIGDKTADPITDTDLNRETDDGNSHGPIEVTPAPTPGAPRTLHAKERVEGIEEYFQNDALVLNIIGGLRENMTCKEIAEILEVTENDVESALRKVRRRRAKISTEGKMNA